MISKLPPPTRVKLRSTQILTTIPQVVSELLQNSLDAGAQHIEISVNCDEWTCWVKDDGSGINKEGLSLIGRGSEEGRYVTSREYAENALNALQTFGFRGEALASAADLCCLEISSRTKSSRDTWAVILKGGKCLYDGPAVRWRQERPGTVVCIRDAFYNLPVRRRSHPTPSKTMELIRREMEIYALVFPSVSFVLENSQQNQGAHTQSPTQYKIPKSTSIITSFRSIYGRALAEHIEEINAESGRLKIHGFISLVGAYTKLYQFLYINRHPVALCGLHHVIDSRFATSFFSKNALDERGEIDLPRSNVRRSPRKVEKKPVYVLNLTVPPDQVDNCLDPAKTSVHIENKTNVVALLSSIVQGFLVRNGFVQVKEETKDHLGIPLSPRKRRKLDFEGDSGYAEFDNGDLGYDNPCRTPQPVPKNVALGNDEMIWNDPKTSQSFIVNHRTGHSYDRIDNGPSIRTRNSPAQIPPRSRRTIAQRPSEERGAAPDAAVPQWILNALKSNQAYTPSEKIIPSVGQTFGNNKLPYGARDVKPQHESRSYYTLWQNTHSRVESLDSSPVSHRFKKGDLGRAVVVGQVDRKFIACIIDSGAPTEAVSIEVQLGSPLKCQRRYSSRTVVLVDQHAADERIRVEQFLKDLCLGFLYSRDVGRDLAKCVPVTTLSPPHPVLLTRHEMQRLSSSVEMQSAFRHWGIQFGELEVASQLTPHQAHDPAHYEQKDPNAADEGYCQVAVESVPEVVSEKLLSGDELQDLIKGFIGQLETGLNESHHQPGHLPADPEDEFHWLTALRWCPEGLHALANSKACRGAIMFNDPLTKDQSERLIRQLSQTAFPFQCAHGRPSLAPAVDLATLETESVSSKGRSDRVTWSNLEKGPA